MQGNGCGDFILSACTIQINILHMCITNISCHSVKFFSFTEGELKRRQEFIRQRTAWWSFWGFVQALQITLCPRQNDCWDCWLLQDTSDLSLLALLNAITCCLHLAVRWPKQNCSLLSALLTGDCSNWFLSWWQALFACNLAVGYKMQGNETWLRSICCGHYTFSCNVWLFLLRCWFYS